MSDLISVRINEILTTYRKYTWSRKIWLITCSADQISGACPITGSKFESIWHRLSYRIYFWSNKKGNT